MATTSTPVEARYSTQVEAIIDGVSLPLNIEAGSVNELRRAIRNLTAAGMIPPRCPVHNRPMKPSRFEEGQFYCTAKDKETGEYCKEKVG